MIFDTIGTPSEEEAAFVTDPDACDYLKIFPIRRPTDLWLKFPGSSNEAVDLIKKMLTFNPFYRASLDECLAHPFLASVRVPERED